jgi:hypothetical protein
MVNNLEKIKELLKFESEDDFYHLQIIKRKKENPDLGSNSYIVKTYYIKSIESLEFYYEEIKMLCKFHNARGCINLNKRSFEKASFHTLKKITDQIMNKDYKSTRNAYNSVCGAVSNAGKDGKRWIIDVDIKGVEGLDETSRLESVLPENTCVALLETKNGWHLITKPFNLQEYRDVVGEHDLHKNNPTILYIP